MTKTINIIVGGVVSELTCAGIYPSGSTVLILANARLANNSPKNVSLSMCEMLKHYVRQSLETF